MPQWEGSQRCRAGAGAEAGRGRKQPQRTEDRTAGNDGGRQTFRSAAHRLRQLCSSVQLVVKGDAEPGPAHWACPRDRIGSALVRRRSNRGGRQPAALVLYLSGDLLQLRLELPAVVSAEEQ